ncbi:MAG TPA: hypothetical protein VIL41_00790 [Coriobacteriia bacterium]
MDRETQISAYVSDSTKQRLDLFVRETGLKKGRVIEDALNAHLDALEELPASAIIPTRIVLTKESGARFLERLEAEPAPTEALIKLMQGHE